ncbi:hypothetical protein J7K44_02755 [bacterium]|nr:hypothetical protein [bacterium]
MKKIAQKIRIWLRQKFNSLLYSKLKIIFIPCSENRYRPKFLDSNFLFYYLIFLVVLKIIIVPVFFYLPKSDFFASLTKETLIELTNRERKALGLNLLKESPILDKAAFQKAKDMLALGYFGHYSPTGKSPWYWIRQAGYQYQRAGENLAIGFLEAEEVLQAWNKSSTHRANIVNPGYEEIGIAVLKGNFQGKETTVVVQLFGSRLKRQNLLEKVKKQEVKNIKKKDVTSQKEKKKEKEFKNKTSSFVNEKTVSSSEVSSTVYAMKETRDDYSWRLLKFTVMNYLKLVNKIVFFSSLLIIAVLVLTILVKIDVQPKDLLIKAICFILIFNLFIFLDKELLINLIPHTLNIG